MPEYRIGDLFSADQEVIAHGCNARGGYASGVAGIMAKLHPAAREAYLHAHRSMGLRLGQVIWARSGNKLIANCITQDAYGRDPGRVYADYEAVRLAMRSLSEQAPEHGYQAVAMPLIGAGLARGHWPTIAKVIDEEAEGFAPIIYARSQRELDMALAGEVVL